MCKLNFEYIFDAWSKLNEVLYKECKEYIKSKLELVSSKSIVFDVAYLKEIPNLSWDGGMPNNCSSRVERVYLMDGEIYLDIEDAFKYSIRNIRAEELYKIAAAVMEIVPILMKNETKYKMCM